MESFLVNHLVEILFGLVAAGSLAFCKYLQSQIKNYKKLLDEKKDEKIETAIDERLEPIVAEIEELRKYIRDVGQIEKHHMDLIISSYRFRLVQLCKEFIRQGYMTQPQYDQLTEFYKLYEALGGNGQAKDYYDKAMKLDIKDE